jgi:hypothetical protein
MLQKDYLPSLLILLAAVLFTSTAQAVNMQTVSVGNPGNIADSSADPNRNGLGAVSYEYSMG